MLQSNTAIEELDLAQSDLNADAVQHLIVCLATGALPNLRSLDLSENKSMGHAGETLAHGFKRLKPSVDVVTTSTGVKNSVSTGAEGDRFACERQLVEGLSAWRRSDLLVTAGGSDMRCPVCNDYSLKQGMITSGGNQYRCDAGCGSYFLHSIGTNDLSLIGLRRRPESNT